jgi:hypothetical protein
MMTEVTIYKQGCIYWKIPPFPLLGRKNQLMSFGGKYEKEEEKKRKM